MTNRATVWRWSGAAPWLALALAVAAVYLRVAAAPFVFDDQYAIVENPSLRALWPLSVPLSPPAFFPTAGRPLVNLSFAVNYAIGGLDPLGYRLFGIALHALSAGLLFSLLGRTLARLGARDPAFAAFCAAAVWALHPLQTEPVAYVTQRTELMMGFCYLATLYASERHWSAESRVARGRWRAAAVVACLAGMASKESMVSAPLVVLLYDRAFVAGSLAEAWRRSRGLHVGLFATWGLLLLLNLQGPRADSAGFHLEVPAVAYWLTQAQVFWTYLRLVVWPWPLVIHYELPYLQTFAAAWPWLAATAGLAAATLVSLARNRATGFAWAAVFASLAPMAIVPIVTEVAAERRMYLPLAAIVGWAVGGGLGRLLGAASEARRARLRLGASAAGVALLLVLGAVSAVRLGDYRDPLTLWRDTVARQPDNALAHNNLAVFLADAGDVDGARRHYEIAIRLAPEDASLYFNLGNLLANARPEQAIAQYEEALRRWPEYVGAHVNLGSVLLRLGRAEEAVAHFERALELAPDDPQARHNLLQARRALRR